MKIRSVTYFTHTGWPLEQSLLEEAGTFITAARQAFSTAGYEVQSTRLATRPFPTLLPRADAESLVSLACGLEEAATLLGYEYVSLGPALPAYPQSYAAIPAALGKTSKAFFGGMLTDGDSVSLSAVRLCAEVICQAASLTFGDQPADGFANLRFAALANVPPGSPFFPAAYHAGNAPSFALATQAADLAVEAFNQARTLGEARRLLIETMQSHAQALERVAAELETAHPARFGGIDFSMAPFPSQLLSLGFALEELGLPRLGSHGSLAAAAFLADTIDQVSFKRAGFSGLMLPVLEDAVLAQRAAEAVISLDDLLMYSCVCGTGLDTVPLPGSATPAQLVPILLDVAALARRLDKPLTARLMPIPGKHAGEATSFDFPFFANSRVMPLRSAPLAGLLAGEEDFTLRRRP